MSAVVIPSIFHCFSVVGYVTVGKTVIQVPNNERCVLRNQLKMMCNTRTNEYLLFGVVCNLPNEGTQKREKMRRKLRFAFRR